MKTNEEKERQKQLKAEVMRNEKEKFLNNLPISAGQFKELFTFLDEQLEQEGCDDTLFITKSYLGSKGIEQENVIAWLEENGGFCDCEVLANVEEKFENI
ncbi:hypothetical protein AAE02nite_01860 [Adhaeribacter aerolatus]|uniref:DUF2695 domain-containing protein n=1 Tax=Adhaeribacter aerolatus TaxID=670289 RepID=A0A512AS44_9BACT|nr:DUF2695 domain-containing protein [Adhaeribacter aerolatus]GEO02522.1 hypothetical protein AAE02nite_01860 [Adhaeribacter aerolatus]